jgi:hypothetical protein
MWQRHSDHRPIARVNGLFGGNTITDWKGLERIWLLLRSNRFDHGLERTEKDFLVVAQQRRIERGSTGIFLPVVHDQAIL